LNLTEFNEIMHATAAVIAGDVKKKTTLKNAKSEPACKKRIHKTKECYNNDLTILNELKESPHIRFA